jgi:hypothetical protein
MKKSILSALLLLPLLFFGQVANTPAESFEILNNSQPEKKEFYLQSISKANLESYRLKEKRVVLDFKNGFQLELLSAKELFLKGIAVDMNQYSEKFNDGYELPLFSVMENGWLGAEVKSKSKFK